MNDISIRTLNIEDLKLIKQIHKYNFEIPDINNLLYASNKVAIVDNKLIAAGFCRLTSEGILIIDEDQPTTLKARIVEALINSMTDEMQNLGMDECHVFADTKIVDFLYKLGFETCNGTPMVRQFYGKK